MKILVQNQIFAYSAVYLNDDSLRITMARFTLRLPDKLNTQLAESARKDGRSKTAHIVWILKTYLAAEKVRKPMADEVWLAMRKKQ